MKRKKKNETNKSEVKPCLGFRFTDEEEQWIAYSMYRARLFMKKYGKGQKVRMINKKHYISND